MGSRFTFRAEEDRLSQAILKRFSSSFRNSQVLMLFGKRMQAGHKPQMQKLTTSILMPAGKNKLQQPPKIPTANGKLFECPGPAVRGKRFPTGISGGFNTQHSSKHWWPALKSHCTFPTHQLTSTCTAQNLTRTTTFGVSRERSTRQHWRRRKLD